MTLKTNQIIKKEDLINYSVAPYELSTPYSVGNTLKDPTTGVIYTCIAAAPAGTPLTNSSYYQSVDPVYGTTAVRTKSYKKGDVVRDPITGVEYLLTKDLPANTVASDAAMNTYLENLTNAVQAQPVPMDPTKSYLAGTEVIDPATGKKYTLVANYVANSAASSAALSTYLQNPANTYPADTTYGSFASHMKSYKKGDVVRDPVTGGEYILTKDLPANTVSSDAAMNTYLENTANAVQAQPIPMDRTKSYPAGTEIIDPVTGKKYTLVSNYVANTAASDAALSTYLQNPANTHPAQSSVNTNGMTTPEVSKSGVTTLSKTELSVAISGNNSDITFAPIADYADGAILFIDVGNYTGVKVNPGPGASIYPDAVNTARNLAPNSTFMYRKQGTTWKWIG